MVSDGPWEDSWLLSRRTDFFASVVSMIIQPWFAEGSPTHAWTSDSSKAVESQLWPVVIALALEAKSPPWLVQDAPPVNRLVHVASFAMANVPLPPGLPAFDVPSPQSAESRCSANVGEAAGDGALLTVTATLADVTTDPAGTLLRSKRTSTRRGCPPLLVPA